VVALAILAPTEARAEAAVQPGDGGSKTSLNPEGTENARSSFD
jgi:hypothetical protein